MKSKVEFLEELTLIAKHKNLKLNSTEYVDMKTNMEFQCLTCFNIFLKTGNDIKYSKRMCHCKFCNKKQNIEKMKTPLFKVEKILKSKGCRLTESGFNGVNYWTQIACLKCNHEFKIQLSNFKKINPINACPKCKPIQNITIDYCNKVSMKFNIKTLSVHKETYGNNYYKKVCSFECQYCFYNFEKNWQDFYKKSNCPRCSGKFLGERLCRVIFETIFNKPFLKTRKLSWLINENGIPLELDGYNDELKIAFEHHGSQHYKELKGSIFRKNSSYTKQKEYDSLKKILCEKNGVKLVEIEDLVNIKQYFKDVSKNNVNSKIPEYIFYQMEKSGIDISDFKHKTIDLSNLIGKKSLIKKSELQNKLNKQNIAIDENSFYISDNIKIKVRCLTCKKVWGMLPLKIKQGLGCPRCQNHEKITFDHYLNLAKERDHKILSQESDYKNYQSKIIVLCNKRGHRWTIIANSYNKGLGKCRKCAVIDNCYDPNKLKIKKYFEMKGRLPRNNSKDKNEISLYNFLVVACSKSKKEYDPEFEKWAVLNGHRSSNKLWTKEECAEIALKYTSRKQFQTFDKKAYISAYNHGWLDEICQHMIIQYGRLTLSHCKELALQCSTSSEFLKKYRSAYSKTKAKGWEKEVMSHFVKEECDKIQCIENGKIYSSIAEAAKDLQRSESTIRRGLDGKVKTTYTFRIIKSNQ